MLNRNKEAIRAVYKASHLTVATCKEVNNATAKSAASSARFSNIDLLLSDIEQKCDQRARAA